MPQKFNQASNFVSYSEKGQKKVETAVMQFCYFFDVSIWIKSILQKRYSSVSDHLAIPLSIVTLFFIIPGQQSGVGIQILKPKRRIC